MDQGGKEDERQTVTLWNGTVHWYLVSCLLPHLHLEGKEGKGDMNVTNQTAQPE